MIGGHEEKGGAKNEDQSAIQSLEQRELGGRPLAAALVMCWLVLA